MDSPDNLDPSASADAGQHEDPSLAQDMRLLAGEVRALAEAELAFQKARATYAGSAAGVIAVLGIVAAVLVFFAVMAAILGTIIALSASLGVWGAMATVSLSLLALAVICALVALAKARRMKVVLGNGGSHGTGG